MFLYGFYREVMTTRRAPTPTSAPSASTIPQADLDDLHDRLARTRCPSPHPATTGTTARPNHYLREMRRPLAHGVRLARPGSADQRVPALPHRDRRPDRPLPPRPVGRAGRDAAAARPHLPGLVRRLPRHDRPARPTRSPTAAGPRTPSRSSSRRCPGFGFSTPLVDRGWTMARVARTFDTLMRRLGYDSYGIARQRRRRDGRARARPARPGRVSSALHVLQLFSFPSGDPAEFEKLDAAGLRGLEHMKWFQSVGGYNAINAIPAADRRRRASPTRRSGSSPGTSCSTRFGNGTSLVTRDQILTQVVAVLVHQHLGRPPAATTTRRRTPAPSRASTPRRTGVAVFADDFQTIRPFAERDNTNIVHWSRVRRRAATSPRWRSRTCWPATSGPSSRGLREH